jgi:hypothetical protein
MSTLHKRSILAVVALAASAAVGAQTNTTHPAGTTATPQAQSQKGFTGEHRSGVWSADTFSRLDTNKDGMISREEAQADATVKGAWSRLDMKNSGKVSRADWDKYSSTQEQSNQFNSGGPAPNAKPKS